MPTLPEPAHINVAAVVDELLKCRTATDPATLADIGKAMEESTLHERELGDDMPGLQTYWVFDKAGDKIAIFGPPNLDLGKMVRIWEATNPAECKYTAGMLRKKQPRRILEEWERGADLYTPKPPMRWYHKLRVKAGGILHVLAARLEADLSSKYL